MARKVFPRAKTTTVKAATAKKTVPKFKKLSVGSIKVPKAKKR